LRALWHVAVRYKYAEKIGAKILAKKDDLV